MEREQDLRKSRPDDLRRAYPEEWARALERAGGVIAGAAGPQAIEARAKELAAAAAAGHATWSALGNGDPRRAGAQVAFVSARLELHALTMGLKQVATRAGAVKGAPAGRSNPRALALGTWAVDRLLFTRSRSRRVPDSRLFRLVWDRLGVRERATLATTIQSLGIYVVFTSQFVQAVKALARRRPILEIGAGDGTLAAALDSAGATISACDDRSWSHRVRCPGWVVEADAANEAERTSPAVVLCAWPPPGNTFERRILMTDAGSTVETYVVVVGATDGAAGDEAAYAEAEASGRWRRAGRPDLSRWLMPPELGSRVLVFEREEAASAAKGAL